MTEAREALDMTAAGETMDPLRQQRVTVYRLLARLLRNAPDEALLRQLAALEQGHAGRDAGNDWQLLGLAARSRSAEQVEDEYHQLFIGLGRGELMPFGSWYLTGYLMEQPLSQLRDDLRALGFERDPSHREPEDHVAALLEVLSMLIEAGDDGAARHFHERHLSAWIERFFEDLEQARNAVFYKSVARIGRRFIGLEARELRG